jgi:homoserine O-acetyltransferase
MTALNALPSRSRPDRGVQLPRYTLVGRTGAPIVVVLGGISATRHVAFGATPGERGWWSRIVGEDKAIDLREFRVLGVDFMDGGRGASGRPRRTITTHDQASWVARVVRAAGASRIHALVGSSYGGMIGLALAESWPDLVERLVVISAPHESHPMSTAYRTLQRRVIELGLETGRAAEAMSIARGIAMTTYRTAGEFGERFPCHHKPRSGEGSAFPVDQYLRYKGEQFAQTMSPHRFLALSLSSDLHRVDPGRIRTPTTIVAAENDTIVPRTQLEELAGRLYRTPHLIDLPTRVGHDAFLVETDRVSAILTNALA